MFLFKRNVQIKYKMKKQLLVIAALIMLASACKVSEQNAPIPINNTQKTADITVPAGFLWTNSRNEYFTVNVTDSQFQNVKYLVAIYDGDPAAGGNLLIKGAASINTPFLTTIFIPNQITQVYIVKISPDNSKVTQNIKLTNLLVTITI
jgi:hypothetical protein